MPDAQIGQGKVRALGNAHDIIERRRLLLRRRENALQFTAAAFLLAEEGRADIGDDAVEGRRVRHREEQPFQLGRCRGEHLA